MVNAFYNTCNAILLFLLAIKLWPTKCEKRDIINTDIYSESTDKMNF